MTKPALSALALLAVLATGTVLAACEDGSNTVTPDAGGGGIDAGNGEGGPTGDGGADAGPSCPKPTAGPTEHQGTVTGEETWTADKSPHIVGSDLGITGSVKIEPCAEVLMGDTKSISVAKGAKLVAEGLAGQPIHIAAQDPTKPFAQLKTAGGTLRFAYADIENGGAPQNSAVDVTGTIYAQGEDQTLPSQPTVFVDHVSVKGSRSNGLYLADGAGFAPGSRELTVTGAASFPLSVWPRAVATIPSGKYTGNAFDELLLPGGGGAVGVQENATMHERGVPYRIGNSLTFGTLVVENTAAGGGGLATLTIEPGVTLRFKKGGELIVETFTGTLAARGALVAVGTATKPIVFTSAEATPTAGDWVGISFNQTPNAMDKIDFARVEFAGGLTSSGSDTCNTVPTIPDAAIRVRGLPAGAFITNTTISNSAAHGIDRGWRDDTKFDFLSTNTFTAVAACKQTFPRDTDGSCPDPVPCP